MCKGTFIICLHREKTGSKLKFKYIISHSYKLTESEVYEEIKNHIVKNYSGWTLVEYLSVS